MMNFAVKTSLGILFMIILINAYVDQSNIKFDKQCQALKCNSSTEICRIKLNCKDDSLKCVYCALKKNLTLSQQQQQQQRQIPFDDKYDLISNSTNDESSYDEYYEYDEDDISDKNEFGDENNYLDDYVEPYDTINDRTQLIRKLGTCPKVVEAVGTCDTEKNLQPDCRFDSDCPGDLKCCEAACGKRVCNIPIKSTVPICPISFQCSLNCRLGYRTDSNGCLKCECQSCPSMEQCIKNCPSGYLKDLFGCDVCECNDHCPPFSCNIQCPPGVGFIQTENGCPLCQCAISKSKPIEHASSCQEDVHCPPGFRCLNDARNVPMCQAVPTNNVECSNDFARTCNLQCPNGNYLVDEKGCRICACASNERISCPEIKCRANCGAAGYVLDENGCQTCKCASKDNVKCSAAMCRMYCTYGFKRDENGCEYCACNESPQECPKLKCQRACKNGYRKDYSGCQTCECNEQQGNIDDKCVPLECDLNCKYGLQRDASGCKMCSCNACPVQTCRMYCMYGFRRDIDGCEICECNWTPVAEKIQCSERIPCSGTRVCNLNLKFCEIVEPDRVNWFLYDFQVENGVFNDQKYVQTFKNGLINNIAEKYDLQTTQITVSSIEQNGLTSFQIMPFYSENMEIFDKKMDQIDMDLNSHEFRSVLPAVARAIEDGNVKHSAKTTFGRLTDKLKNFTRNHPKSAIGIIVLLLLLSALIIISIIYITVCRRHFKYSTRSDSKVPIYDASYQQAPTDEDHYHNVYAPVDLKSDEKAASV